MDGQRLHRSPCSGIEKDPANLVRNSRALRPGSIDEGFIRSIFWLERIAKLLDRPTIGAGRDGVGLQIAFGPVCRHDMIENSETLLALDSSRKANTLVGWPVSTEP